MTSSPVDVILLAALVLTTGSVLFMHRKLKRLETHHAEYQRILAQTAKALAAARDAVAALNGNGREIAATLGTRIEQANAVIRALDAKCVETRLPDEDTAGGRTALRLLLQNSRAAVDRTASAA